MKAHIRSTWHPKYTLCEIPHSKYLTPCDDTMELCQKCKDNAYNTMASAIRIMKGMTYRRKK